MLTALLLMPFDRPRTPRASRPRRWTLAAGLALAVLAGGCAGSGWSANIVDLGDVDGIVEAPPAPTDAPRLAKVSSPLAPVDPPRLGKVRAVAPR